MSKSCATLRVACLFLLMTCVVLARLAAAQGLTGALIGTVKDGEGGVLPGAVLRITSPALIGRELKTTTNEKGQLRFAALPPGAYSLDIEMPRFATYHEENISIGAGATIERTVVLKLAGMAESLTVQGAGSRIEARGSGLETRLRSEDLRAIPTGRFSMFDLVRTAPGISPTSASGTTTTVSATSVSALGSSVNENQFLIDGTNFTCPCSGVARSEPGVDFIQEVQLVQNTPESTRYAVASFEKAVQTDPRDALAHAGLASASAVMRIRFAPEPELQGWVDRAQKEAAAALALDPNMAEAHDARAAVARNLEFDWDLTINESDRALALNPSLETPHFYRAAAFYHFGLFDRARAEIRLGMENNPVSGSEPLRLLGTTALLGGQFAEAESALRSAQGLTTISESASTYLAQALYYQGKKTEGEEILTVVAASKSAQARRRAQATLASYLGARNEHVKARALITDVLAGTYMDHHVAYGLGVAFAQVGDLAEARRWLTRAAAEGFPCYPWFANDPLMRPLKSDPAFQEFMKQLSNRFDANRARFGG
jgi:tetratricopeptide (TPR) repeat protein